MIKTAIIFDFDYTLADSSAGAVECIHYALQSMGEEMCSRSECCTTIGLSLHDTYIKLTGKNDPQKTAVFSKRFIEKADQVMALNTHLYDGVGDLLHRLNATGFVLGIVSTKFRYRINQILGRYGLIDQFSEIIGGEDVIHHKPDPDGINLFIAKASIKPEEVLLVGDSLIDAETALRSGVDFMAVLTGSTQAEQFSVYSPKAIIESVIEIESYF